VVWLKPTKGQISIGRKLISERLKDKNIKVDVMECSGLTFFKSFIKILRSDYDFVIGTTHLGLAGGGLIKIFKKIPIIADFVDEYEILLVDTPKLLYPVAFVVILLEKLSLKIADAVVVVPQKRFAEISKDRCKVFKTNLCVDVDKFLFSGSHRAVELLEKNKVKLTKPKIIYVGGFSEIYNLDILIESMKYLPEFQLIMIGGGRLENKLKDLKEKLNLRNVYFLGYQTNDIVAEIMKLGDVGVTLCEVPRQLKIYEYLAAGLRVVVPESVLSSEDFEFAEYCVGAKLDVKDVAEKIKIVMKMPRKRDKRLMKLLEKYNCRRVAEVYEHVIRSIYF